MGPVGGEGGVSRLVRRLHAPTDLTCHVHHTLVYKSDLPCAQQYTDAVSIDEPINLMLVCAHPCHEVLQSDRQAGLEFKQARFGEETAAAYIRRMRPRTAPKC